MANVQVGEVAAETRHLVVELSVTRFINMQQFYNTTLKTYLFHLTTQIVTEPHADLIVILFE